MVWRLTRRARAKGLLTLAVGRGEEDGGSMLIRVWDWSPKEGGAGLEEQYGDHIALLKVRE